MKIRRTKKGKVRRGLFAKKMPARKNKNDARTRTLIVRSWWVLRGIAAGFLALALIYVFYIGTGKVITLPALAVKTIHVEGFRGIDSEDVVRMSGIRIGQPLLRIDLKEVRGRVIRHPVVRDAAVVRELPDTIRIAIEERTPAAVVMDRDFSFVDMEGVVLSHSTVYTGDFPIITGVNSIPGTGKVALEALPALDAMRDLTSSGFLSADKISELRISSEQLLVSLTGNGTLLILPRGDVNAAFMKLARFMERGLFDARAPGYDLRFEKRIVVMPERTVSSSGMGTIPLAGG